MAVIAGKSIGPGVVYPHHRRRIVIRFKPDVSVPYLVESFAGLSGLAQLAWANLRSTLPGSVMRPYFDTALDAPVVAFAKRAALQGLGVFEKFFALECPPGLDLAPAVRVLNMFPEVEIAYPESGPVPPPVTPEDDVRSSGQHYLDAAPVGIDARYAWSLGADGRGVGFVDMEQGWTLDHQDLADAHIGLISGLNQAYFGHGTAVLGQVRAVDNAIGCIGIAPQAGTRVVSQFRTSEDYQTASAILSAAATMSGGDVLLLEAQTYYGDSTIYFPVEVEDAVCVAIQHAVAAGIVVVEAAGNGFADLDDFQDSASRRTLNRAGPDFRDSGAIMVGAASVGVPHRRLAFSNHGSRIDCFGWGESINTLGDGEAGKGRTTYTTDFGGTSGASPIVAGAAILVQSKRIRDGQPPLSPEAMRRLLGDSGINTRSHSPATDRIGVMPDLRRVIGALA